MQLVPNAKSYATRKNAERRLRTLLGETMDKTRWFIIAQADGRFTPAVMADDPFLTVLAHQGVAVIR